MHGQSSGDTSTRLGPYRIVKRLGIGGTSEVLLAISQGPYGFERTVVIKRLLPKCEWDPAQSRMLAAEAVAYARLTHPAIVRLYDFFAPGGHVALVLEYVDGPSLARLRTLLRVQREQLGDAPAMYIASRVFSALAAAHAARDPHTGEFAPVIHRDVSPGNILLPWDGFVKLGDFGLAKVTGISVDTRAGMLKGTFGYMAPEQVLGERVTPRTDVYAGCLLLREMLLSKQTFTQGQLPEFEFLRAMAEPHLEPIEELRSGVSKSLADALRRGLQVDPEKRTLTAQEMMYVLRSETNLEEAHGALVAKLARVRPPEPRASTPPHGIQAVGTSPLSTTVRFFNRFEVPGSVPEPEVTPQALPMVQSALDTMHAMHAQEAPVHSEPPQVMMLSSRPALDTIDERYWTQELRKRGGLALASALIGIAACVGLVLLLKGRPPLHAPTMASARPPASTPVVALPPVPKPVVSAPVAPAPPAVSAAPVLPAKAPASDASTPLPVATGDIVTPESMHAHRVFLDGQFALPHSGATLHVKCGRHAVRVGSRGRVQSVEVPCGGVVTVSAR